MARNSRFDGGSGRSRYNMGGSRFNGSFKKGSIGGGGAGRSYGASNSRGYDDYSRYGGGGNPPASNGNGGSNGAGGGGGGMRHTRFD